MTQTLLQRYKKNSNTQKTHDFIKIMASDDISQDIIALISM